MAAIRRDEITGLVLAGGRGSRMGGVDKGLQLHHGVPLALHAVRRLAPQVGNVVVNANRHLDRYAAFGVPLCRDADGGDGHELPAYAGPLAGFLAGLQRCTTPYLATVPCDSPDFPLDLVGRLAESLAAQAADIAMASTPVGGSPAASAGAGSGTMRRQPVFCLMRTAVADDLQRYLDGGDRQVGRWAARHRCVDVPFDDDMAFVNANTLEDLALLQTARPRRLTPHSDDAR